MQAVWIPDLLLARSSLPQARHRMALPLVQSLLFLLRNSGFQGGQHGLEMLASSVSDPAHARALPFPVGRLA